MRNTNIKLELGMDEIKYDIQKSTLSWFGHLLWMRDERVPKKMLHTKMEGNDKKENPEPDG